MKSIIIFTLLVCVCWAQQQQQQQLQQQQQEENESVSLRAAQRPSRAPQGHIQYSDPDGLKVSWKLYAPYSQWKSHLESPQRNQRAESGTAQPAYGPQTDLIKPAAATAAPVAVPADEKVAQPVHQVQVQYKPYSMVPTHIKQLILEMYEPQGPYVDPSVYIYQAHRQEQEEEQKQQNAEEQEESAQATSQAQYDTAQVEYEPKYPTKYHNKAKYGYIQYKDEQPTVAESAAPQYGAVPERKEYVAEEQQQQQQQPQQQQSAVDDGMPKELHQLLNLQAQIPYHVIANRIVYKPKSIFVPKPFTDELKGPYKYRSKVYYVKDEDVDEQNNKERTEREEQKEQQHDE